MSYFTAVTGQNTVHGLDTGTPPPGVLPGGIAQYPSSAFYPGMPPAAQAYGYQAQISQPSYVMQPMNFTGYPGMTCLTNVCPPDYGFPGTLFRNSTGGKGLEPGYSYLYPQQHTKIHVFKTKTKPWQSTIWTNDTRTHVKLYVPVTTTTKELMQNLGCSNDDASKNILYECVERANGQWTAGMQFKGDDKDRMKKPISDWGWDSSRTGGFGKNPVVWLWCTSGGA